jgi:hypothetical protein
MAPSSTVMASWRELAPAQPHGQPGRRAAVELLERRSIAPRDKPEELTLVHRHLLLDAGNRTNGSHRVVKRRGNAPHRLLAMGGGLDLDAVGQAELVRTGEASPPELVDAAIERIERLNPGLNAVIHPLFESARVAATTSVIPTPTSSGVVQRQEPPVVGAESFESRAPLGGPSSQGDGRSL